MTASEANVNSSRTTPAKPGKGWTACESLCDGFGSFAVEVPDQDWDAIEAGTITVAYQLVECDDCDGKGWHPPITAAELAAQEAAYRARRTQRELDHLTTYHAQGERVGDSCAWAFCRVARGTA